MTTLKQRIFGDKDKKAEIQKFESMRYEAELRALSNTSQERPLTDKEFARMKELSKKIYGVYTR
jgi:hypothetical protein